MDNEPLAPKLPDFFFDGFTSRDKLGPTLDIDHVLDIVS